MKALRKARKTRTQKGEIENPMSIQEKIENMKDAFEVASPITGQRILLVDDMIDSGVTLMEAALALRSRGASDVSVLVMAALSPSRLSFKKFLELRNA